MLPRRTVIKAERSPRGSGTHRAQTVIEGSSENGTLDGFPCCPLNPTTAGTWRGESGGVLASHMLHCLLRDSAQPAQQRTDSLLVHGLIHPQKVQEALNKGMLRKVLLGYKGVWNTIEGQKTPAHYSVSTTQLFQENKTKQIKSHPE